MENKNKMSDMAVERPGTPDTDTDCSICLGQLDNKSKTNACRHIFCYGCLKRWSTVEPFCPLCRTKFRNIYHTFTDQGNHETYNVPLREIDIISVNLVLDNVQNNETLMNNLNNFEPVLDRNHSLRLGSNERFITRRVPNHNYHPLAQPRNRAAVRIQVYTDNMWAYPLPDSNGRFRECSSTFYRENPAELHRLRNFVLRDSIAIRINERTSTVPFGEIMSLSERLTEIVLQTIADHDIRNPFTVNYLTPHFGRHTSHFIHEIYNFALSPYDLRDYDRNVNYVSRQTLRPHVAPLLHRDNLFRYAPPRTGGPPPSNPLVTSNYISWETIELDYNDRVETDSRPNGQGSSNEDNSHIENHPRPFTETLDSSRHQPSTSTGIRDSIIRRNNVRRRPDSNNRRCSCGEMHMNCSRNIQLSRDTYALRGSRRPVNTLDSSADDEERPIPSRVVTRPSVHVKSVVVPVKRKRTLEKTEAQKRPRTGGPPPNNNPLVTPYFSRETDDGGVVADSRPNGQGSSSRGNLHIENHRRPFHFTETLDSSRHQPSTSTGIRDSIIRRNNMRRPDSNNRRCSCGEMHMNCSRNIQLSRDTYAFRGSRRPVNTLDSSSVNEERPIVHVKSVVVPVKRKIKLEKTEAKKRKTTVTRSEVRIGNSSRPRSRSYSSSDETEI